MGAELETGVIYWRWRHRASSAFIMSGLIFIKGNYEGIFIFIYEIEF